MTKKMVNEYKSFCCPKCGEVLYMCVSMSEERMFTIPGRDIMGLITCPSRCNVYQFSPELPITPLQHFYNAIDQTKKSMEAKE